MHLLPLNRMDVQVGKEARFDIFDANGNKLLSKGVVIASESICDRLLERGRRLPHEGSAGAGRGEDAVPRGPQTIFTRLDGFSLELAGIHEAIIQVRGSAHCEALDGLARRLIACLEADQDALLAALQIGCEQDTAATRMLHVCVLAELIAQRLELAQAERLVIRRAALTYDLGMHALRDEFSAHHGELSSDQVERLHAHPSLAVEMLARAGIDDAHWHELVLSHHERIDGSGYPRGLGGEQITRPMRILALADIYSAMIRPRVYREALNARLAMRTIFQERGRMVDQDLTAILIKAVGLYPPGSFVRLASGEVAVVVARSENANLPEIRAVVSIEGMPRAVPVRRDPQDPAYAIIGEVSASGCRFPMAPIRKLWK
jgi:HD-GYP domain-containing protein (c-di-GMP phosphodiesterase class II)